MGIVELLLIAVGLSMDALAVSVASGALIRELRIKHALKIGLFFGGFQALMPFIGWLCGVRLKAYISGVDHWIAFIILAFIGGKMIYEAFELKEDTCRKADPCDTRLLFVLAVATSIDALAVGLSFSLLGMTILMPVLVIGAVTFAISFAGVYAGNRFGHLFENKIEIAGGVILIAIGLKILIEHLMGG